MKKVFIAGGTSGIGLAVARLYKQQNWDVAVCGRSINRLDDNYKAILTVYELDVCNKKQLEDAVNHFCPTKDLDLMIITIGNYSNEPMQKLTYQESIDMPRINILGVVNCIEVAREAMSDKGHIVITASVSGILNYPQATIYSKTKRAVIQIGDAYRRALKDFGIKVTVVAPGYVDTVKLRELNHNDLSKSSLLSRV